jgi:very-short-patch-repair endonuclease
VDLDTLLLRQAGVVGLHQAVAAGVSARTVQRRVASGAWRPLHPRVYLAGGHRLTDEARIRAAALWCGDEATVSGAAAAYWHGMMPRAAGPVDVTVPREVRRRSARGVLAHRRDLAAEDRVRLRGLWLTAGPLTALETATELIDGSTFLDRALQRHVRLDDLRIAHSRTLGRRGSRQAGRLLAAAGDGTESMAERKLVAHLRRAGVTGWVLGFRLGPHVLDLAFPAARLAVEVDGWAWHTDPARFAADCRKGNAITRTGCDLLRFTWHDVDGRPDGCVQEIMTSWRAPPCDRSCRTSRRQDRVQAARRPGEIESTLAPPTPPEVAAPHARARLLVGARVRAGAQRRSGRPGGRSGPGHMPFPPMPRTRPPTRSRPPTRNRAHTTTIRRDPAAAAARATRRSPPDAADAAGRCSPR